MFRDKKTGRWRAMVTVNGRRISKLCATRAIAERTEYELKHGLVKADGRRERTTFREFAERWYRDYCLTCKAPSQWRRDRYTLDKHLIPALGDVRLSELKRAHAYDLVATLRRKTGRGEHTLSEKTVNNAVGLAKTMLRAATQWDLLEGNPWGEVEPLKVPERAHDWWSVSELEVFAKKAREKSPELTRIVELAFYTGLRAGELAALRYEDLDFKSGLITARATVCLTTGRRTETTKGKKVGYVEMNSAVRRLLEPARFLKQGDSVFSMALFWYLCRRFRRLCKAVGSRQIRFHDLRHSFASNLAAAGVDPMAIQRKMRHASYQMTLKYTHLHPDYGKLVTEVLCTPAQPAHNGEGVPVKSGGPRVT